MSADERVKDATVQHIQRLQPLECRPLGSLFASRNRVQTRLQTC